MIVVREKEDIKKITQKTREILIYYYLTNPMLSEILKRKPKLKELRVNASTKIRSKTRERLRILGVRLTEVSQTGRPPIYPKKFVENIRQEHAAGRRVSDLSHDYDIPFSSVQYLLFERKLTTDSS